jgi:hypothetical protein
MTAFTNIFGGYADAQARLREARAIERVLVRYFESRHIQIIEIWGVPTVNIVRCFEADEAITMHLSLEALAQYLAAEWRHDD